jgi:hypothetical protein
MVYRPTRTTRPAAKQNTCLVPRLPPGRTRRRDAVYGHTPRGNPPRLSKEEAEQDSIRFVTMRDTITTQPGRAKQRCDRDRPI